MKNSLTRFAILLGLCGVLSSCFPLLDRVYMPPVNRFEAYMASAPQVVTVIEPHLSTSDSPVRVDYVGYPAEKVLSFFFGDNWKDPRMEVEFRATDGYVARIPSSKFLSYQASLVYRRQDGAAFEVDNLVQNLTHVPLGPYYLVWNNIAAPELLPEGASDWPYQIEVVALSSFRSDALLPGTMAATYTEHAALTQKYCLTCHQVNGYGGDKMPTNLALEAKQYSQARFLAWVLSPTSVKADTTMPALLPLQTEAQRLEVANKIYDYLRTVPVAR